VFLYPNKTPKLLDRHHQKALSPINLLVNKF